MGGPLHSWFSSVGCLASLPYETPEAVVQAIDKRPGHTTGTHYVSISCSILGILSRYRAFSLGDGQQRFKLGSIYLQRPGDLKVAHAIAEIPGIESEILIEDWSTRNGRFEELDGWTRFQVDLKKDCLEPGYFLSAYGSVYMPVPERERQRAGWLLQAQSILNRTGLLERGWDHQDMLIAELFFVYLDWQLFIVDDGTPGSDDLPSSIYLFVENIPVDSGGVISKPSTFWSVDPRGTVTDLDIGSRLWSEGWFSVRGSGRSWENYHYAAAQVLQETSGFDPTTTSAANSHGFSTYEVSTLPIPEKGDGPKGLSETVTSSNDMQSVAVIGRLQ
ncbi:hypothetical protein B0H10DRAFT_2054615 [Mycena sp. CBHHK59/15]|nr:hypothetical protein B0H10DRAFT_2054615 [Mycena sp. CBHHK59/15]